MYKSFGAILIDRDIRNSVLCRMIPNGADMASEQRKEIFARYVATDQNDAELMQCIEHGAAKLLTVSEYQTWLAFGKDCVDADGVVRIDLVS